jgi:hypothetical protein
MGVMTSFEFRGDCAAEFLNLNGNVTHRIAQNQQQYHAAYSDFNNINNLSQ